MIVKAEGIVIKSIDYGESSKIITLFTRAFGKVSVLAKGAKKTNSRVNAITQLFTYGQYTYYMGKQMGTLNQGQVEQRFSDIYIDIEKTSYAAYLVELVDRMIEPNQPTPHLFEQLLSSLEGINGGKDPEILSRIFEMKILQIAGYRPRLISCSICESDQDLTSFSIPHGGVICKLHKDQGIILQQGTIKLLQIFQTIDIKRVGNISVKDSTKSQLQHIMRSFFDEYVGVTFKSRNFLDQLKNF